MPNNLVSNAQKALLEFCALDQAKIDEIVEAATQACVKASSELAQMAVDETGRGNAADKDIKNGFVLEHVTSYMKSQKTCGVIKDCWESGIVEIAEPLGVICAMTPVTNPTSTVIFKALICLKTRNPVIFSAHPAAAKCSIKAAQIVLEAAVKAGAPKHCIQWLDSPTLQGTSDLMNHEGVSAILATGGSAMVKAAYSCGKPALGVGPGNVPSYVEASANIQLAVSEILTSKAFDNGMICCSEQALIADAAIYDEVVAELKKHEVHMLSGEEKAKIEALYFGASKDQPLNAQIVGQSAQQIASLAGFSVDSKVKVLVAQCKSANTKEEPLSREKLSPVLALIKSKDFDEGSAMAALMVEDFGKGHTAAIYSKCEEKALAFAHKVKAVRILHNQPSTFGGIGSLYNSLIPSMTLGCGSWGKNATSVNVNVLSLINVKRLAKRLTR